MTSATSSTRTVDRQEAERLPEPATCRPAPERPVASTPGAVGLAYCVIHCSSRTPLQVQIWTGVASAVEGP
jgi:hypothetical protein